MTTPGDIGERELIDRVRGMFPTNHSVVTGIGDDCAVVRCESSDSTDLVLTSDALIEGVHFLPTADEKDIGHKAIARALSDIGAMGARPMWAVVDVVAPASFDVSRVEAIASSAAHTAGGHTMVIVGGDTTCGQTLELHVFAVGQVPRDTAILRSGASAEDSIYVTGDLGGSAARRNMTFEPRVQQGAWLREGGWATAMIDISDGLSVDLHHLAHASSVGAVIHEESLPVSAVVRDSSPVEHALHDGEDYELLFTVTSGREKSLESAWVQSFDLELSRIGRATDEDGAVKLVSADGNVRDIEAGGYEHFASPAQSQ